jgi:hypothetical protein
MANLNDYYQSIINQINATGAFPFVRIWNDQLSQLEDGATYAFPFPNAFVEVLMPANYLPLGGGYSISEVTVRIHIGHIEYDAGGGYMDQNTNVFAFRNIMIAALNNFQPTGGSSLMKVAELQDYQHTNMYHYQIDFKGTFIDSTSSTIDGGVTGEITDVIFSPIGDPDPRADIEVVDHIDGQTNEDYRKFKLFNK